MIFLKQEKRQESEKNKRFYKIRGNPMNLRVYLAEKNIRLNEFCKLLDVNHCYLSRVVNGFRPGRKLARNIEKATEGRVTAAEILKEKQND